MTPTSRGLRRPRPATVRVSLAGQGLASVLASDRPRTGSDTAALAWNHGAVGGEHGPLKHRFARSSHGSLALTTDEVWPVVARRRTPAAVGRAGRSVSDAGAGFAVLAVDRPQRSTHPKGTLGPAPPPVPSIPLPIWPAHLPPAAACTPSRHSLWPTLITCPAPATSPRFGPHIRPYRLSASEDCGPYLAGLRNATPPDHAGNRSERLPSALRIRGRHSRHRHYQTITDPALGEHAVAPAGRRPPSPPRLWNELPRPEKSIARRPVVQDRHAGHARPAGPGPCSPSPPNCTCACSRPRPRGGIRDRRQRSPTPGPSTQTTAVCGCPPPSTTHRPASVSQPDHGVPGRHCPTPKVPALSAQGQQNLGDDLTGLSPRSSPYCAPTAWFNTST